MPRFDLRQDDGTLDPLAPSKVLTVMCHPNNRIQREKMLGNIQKVTGEGKPRRHPLRRAAGNLWSVSDPTNVRGVKDLLGHADFGTTEKHYIGAQSRLAGRALAKVLRSSRH